MASLRFGFSNWEEFGQVFEIGVLTNLQLSGKLLDFTADQSITAQPPKVAGSELISPI